MVSKALREPQGREPVESVEPHFSGPSAGSLRGYLVRGESLERATGVEPATSSLGSWHSTAELRPLTSNTG